MYRLIIIIDLRLFIYCLFILFIHSFIHLFDCSFIHSLNHLFIMVLTRPHTLLLMKNGFQDNFREIKIKQSIGSYLGWTFVSFVVVEECAVNICMNNGICTRRALIPTCACLPKFTGTYCEEEGKF